MPESSVINVQLVKDDEDTVPRSPGSPTKSPGGSNPVLTNKLQAVAVHKDPLTTETVEKASLTLPDGRAFRLPLLRPTMGEEVVLDIRNIDGVFFYDPGFNSVAACASAITYLDPGKEPAGAGRCLYRGYDVTELVKSKRSYLEVAYLLLYGNLPNAQGMRLFQEQINDEMMIHTRLQELISTFIPGCHPMAMLSSVLAASASIYDDPMSQRHMAEGAMRELACVRIIAKFPTIVAMIYKVLVGEPFVYPRRELSLVENFLMMMFSGPTKSYKINPLHREVLETLLVLHHDHELNASTSTVRTAGSSLANPYACVAAGVTSLWGRAHGGANEAVIDMLEEIGSVEHVPEFIRKVKNKEVRLMGFGHRVYRNYDPRAQIMQEFCHKLFESGGDTDPLFSIARKLEKYATEDWYFRSRRLYPNVDFYSGIVMRALGIPQEMFTVMFALGRCVGWLSHWKEMVEERLIKIARPRQLYLGPKYRQVPDCVAEEGLYGSDISVPFHVVQSEIVKSSPSNLDSTMYDPTVWAEREQVYSKNTSSPSHARSQCSVARPVT